MTSVSLRDVLSRRPIALMALVAASAVLAVAAFGWVWVSGDPLVYHRLMSAILGEGRLPYFDAPFEHFPLMLLPMAVVWYVGGSAGEFEYRAVWTALTMVALLVTVRAMRPVAEGTGIPDLGWRWVLVSIPLVPIVLFRTEPWVVLPAVIAVAAMLHDRVEAAGLWTTLATLAKGWPAVVALAGLARRRYRWPLLSLSVVVVVLVPVVSSDGFRLQRGFPGLHAESVGGSLAGLWQILKNAQIVLVEAAGAAYVETDRAWAAVGVCLAFVVFGRLWRAARRSVGDFGALPAMGAVVAGVLVASPLQSTQFLFWLTPFAAAASSSSRLLMVLAGGIGLFNLITFESMVMGRWWWFASVVMRNMVLVMLGWRLASEAQDSDGRIPCGDSTGSG